MLKPVPFSNAVTSVWLVAYLICATIAYVYPALLLTIMGDWFHGLAIQMSNKPEPIPFNGLILGLFTFGLTVWVMSYFIAVLYNRFTK